MTMNKIDEYTQSGGGVSLNAKTAQDRMLDTKQFTISAVEFVDFGDGEKPVVKVEEIAEGIPLNKGNARALKEAYGSDHTKWAGKVFTLFVIDRIYDGQPTKGLLLKPVPGASK